MTTYVFRVWLRPNPPLGFDPDEAVWREIKVDSSHTLDDFHEAIFEAFDRWEPHGYEFLTHDEDGIATRSYVHPNFYDCEPSWPAMDADQLDSVIEQAVPDDVAEGAKQRFRELRTNPPTEANAAETTIDELGPERWRSLFYEFDFGDGWEHYIELQGTYEGSLDGEPVVVAEQGAAPPQYPELDD